MNEGLGALLVGVRGQQRSAGLLCACGSDGTGAAGM